MKTTPYPFHQSSFRHTPYWSQACTQTTKVVALRARFVVALGLSILFFLGAR